ncbi:MAG: YaaR family protein [Lachnospiraceae bacterium]|nr:YaaR family protein [Lachnospiraceae bacterium]
MDIRVNETQQINQTQQSQRPEAVDDTFKFTLTSAIEDADLSEKLNNMLKDISLQGNLIAKRHDISEMRKYRQQIKEFLNEIVNRSHKFSREGFLDRKGRHRVYGIIRLIDSNLDELAKLLMEDEKRHIDILNTIGEIEGLLIDIIT